MFLNFIYCIRLNSKKRKTKRKLLYIFNQAFFLIKKIYTKCAKDNLCELDIHKVYGIRTSTIIADNMFKVSIVPKKGHNIFQRVYLKTYFNH